LRPTALHLNKVRFYDVEDFDGLVAKPMGMAANASKFARRVGPGELKIWDVSTGDEVHTIQHVDGPFVFSHDGKHVLVGTTEGISLVDIADHREVGRTARPVRKIQDIFISDNDTRVAALSELGVLSIWDLSAGKMVWSTKASFGQRAGGIENGPS